MSAASAEKLADLAARAAEAEQVASEKAVRAKAAAEKVAAESRRVQAKVAAFKRAFEAILAAIAVLEVERAQSPRELRNDGNLGGAVAAASSAANDGLKLIAR